MMPIVSAERGFLSSLLLVVFAGFAVSLANLQSSSVEMEGTTAALMANEKCSLIRALLEESTDRLIENTLRVELLAGNASPVLANKAVSAEIFRHLRESEGLWGECSVSFSLKPLFVEGRELENEMEIELLSKVNIETVSKNAVLAEFHFTGGALKDTSIEGKIRCGKSSATFKIPAGYKKSIIEAWE